MSVPVCAPLCVYAAHISDIRKEYKIKQNATVYMKLNLDRRNDYDDTLPDIGDQRGYRAGALLLRVATPSLGGCGEWRFRR